MVKNLISTIGLKARDTSKNLGIPAKIKARDYDVVLHIGAPKAGSSALQSFCLKNRQLLAQQGYYYPEHTLDKNEISGGHSFVGGPLVKGEQEKASQNFASLLREAKTRGLCLLLSAEAFYGQFVNIRAITEDLKVGVIAYFRDPIESTISNYNQSVKRHFRTERLEELVLGRLQGHQKGLSGQIFADWHEQFGRDHVLLLPYWKQAFPQDKIEFSLLSCLGIAAADWSQFQVSGRIVNASYTAPVLEVKRLLNRILPADNPDLASRVDWCLQGYSDAHPQAKASPAELLGPQLYQQLLEKFASSNKQLKETLLDVDFPGFLAAVAEPVNGPANKLGFKELSGVMDEAFASDAGILAEFRRQYAGLLVDSFSSDSVTLGHLLNMPVQNFSVSRPAFKKDELAVLLADAPKYIDFYKQQALMLERSGNFRQAQLFIDKAHKIRPNSVQLKKLAERIKIKGDRV